jgi:hypothetical protein
VTPPPAKFSKEITKSTKEENLFFGFDVLYPLFVSFGSFVVRKYFVEYGNEKPK